MVVSWNALLRRLVLEITFPLIHNLFSFIFVNVLPMFRWKSWWSWYFFPTCCWFCGVNGTTVGQSCCCERVWIYKRLKHNKPQNVFNFYFTKFHLSRLICLLVFLFVLFFCWYSTKHSSFILFIYLFQVNVQIFLSCLGY